MVVRKALLVFINCSRFRNNLVLVPSENAYTGPMNM